MKILLSLYMLFCGSIAWASADYRVGDVILVPLYCYSCTIIERETGSSFSHSGVLLKDEQGAWMVAESLGDTHLVSIDLFLSRVRPGRRAALYRHIESESFRARQMLKVFRLRFEGLPFDKLYLWNNFDEEGRELLYCSEFVTKFLNRFTSRDLMPTPMDFRGNWEFWEQVYGVGNVPQGEPGNSPGSIEFSPNFYKVKDL